MFKIKTPSLEKSILAKNPANKIKRKFSANKYIDPVGTTKRKLYGKVYRKTTISIFDPFMIGLIIFLGAIYRWIMLIIKG